MSKIYYERPKQHQNRGKKNNQVKYYSRMSGNSRNQNDGSYENADFQNPDYDSYEGADFTGRGEAPYMSMEEQEQRYYQPSYAAPQYDSARNAEGSRRKRNIKEWIANGVLIVLSLSLVISMAVLISEVRYMTNQYSRTARTFWYEINEGQYTDVIKGRHTNEVNGVVETPELRECYAVADYFEAASLYKVAVHTGNTEDMEKYLAVMEEAYKLFEDVPYIADDINAKLGLEVVLK